MKPSIAIGRLDNLFVMLITLCLTFCGVVSAQMLPRTSMVGIRDSSYLSVALKAEQWLQSMRLDKDNQELAWRTVQDSKLVSTDLYSGTSGIVLFYLELFTVTKDSTYLQKAEQGLQYIISTTPETWRPDKIGLYTGACGLAFVTNEFYRISGKSLYQKHSRLLLERVQTMIQQDFVHTFLANDIMSGYAGIGLTMLYASKYNVLPDALKIASSIGNVLLSRALQVTGEKNSSSLRWSMYMSDTARKAYLPNFSHGTAGVCYFLAQLYETTKERRFLDAALKGASHLASITNDSGWIYHAEPTGKDRYYLSWCHGPAGTARLYYKLFTITGDTVWKQKIVVAARAMMQCGIPTKKTSGYWNNVGFCCGDAGVVSFFLHLYQQFGSKEYQVFSNEVLSHLLQSASVQNSGLAWIHAENRRQPSFVYAQTGFMQGASGIGWTLLQAHLATQHKMPQILLPDNPF